MRVQILLALPDRPETLQFFELADKAGVTWRRLRWYSPPDLVTPVSVYQFVLLLSSCPSRTPHHHVSTSEASPSKRSKVGSFYPSCPAKDSCSKICPLSAGNIWHISVLMCFIHP